MIFQPEAFLPLDMVMVVPEIHQIHFELILDAQKSLTFFTTSKALKNLFNAVTKQEILLFTLSTYTNCILRH